MSTNRTTVDKDVQLKSQSTASLANQIFVYLKMIQHTDVEDEFIGMEDSSVTDSDTLLEKPDSSELLHSLQTNQPTNTFQFCLTVA